MIYRREQLIESRAHPENCPIEFGPLSLRFLGREYIWAESIEKTKHRVETAKYELKHDTEGWSVILGYAFFPDKKDVRCLEYSDHTPDGLHRLSRGLRMGINYSKTINKEWVELSQARIKKDTTPKWSALVKATDVGLTRGAGLDLRNLMKRMGASFGTRASILKDKSNRRGYYCAAFPVGDEIVPIVAYGVTRILPLIRIS